LIDINSKSKTIKWHILKEDSLLQDKVKEGRTIMQSCPPWLSAPIAVHGTSITLYVVNVVITEANWQLKKR
jgi:hypothetical protein